MAQIAEAAGYEGLQASANDTLAELMLRYVLELGSAAHSYAELAGRTGFNAADLVCPSLQAASKGGLRELGRRVLAWRSYTPVLFCTALQKMAKPFADTNLMPGRAR